MGGDKLPGAASRAQPHTVKPSATPPLTEENTREEPNCEYLALLAGAPSVQPANHLAENDEPNRVYLGWAAFEPGAWVVKKSANEPDAETRQVLKSVTSTEAVVEARTTLRGRTLRKEILRIPARVSAPSGDIVVKTSKKTLKINRKRVRCYVERGPLASFWYSSEIPGGVARWEAKVPGLFSDTQWVIAWGEKPE